jgi:hypothetical protein
MRLLRGRDFTEADTLEAPGVVLVNESFARRFLPNEDPIGQHVHDGEVARRLGRDECVWLASVERNRRRRQRREVIERAAGSRAGNLPALLAMADAKPEALRARNGRRIRARGGNPSRNQGSHSEPARADDSAAGRARRREHGATAIPGRIVEPVRRRWRCCSQCVASTACSLMQ